MAAALISFDDRPRARAVVAFVPEILPRAFFGQTCAASEPTVDQSFHRPTVHSLALAGGWLGFECKTSTNCISLPTLAHSPPFHRTRKKRDREQFWAISPKFPPNTPARPPFRPTRLCPPVPVVVFARSNGVRVFAPPWLF